MNQNVIYVGIDVDDVHGRTNVAGGRMPRATDERYHGCALDKSTGEALDFRCRSTLNGLVRQFPQFTTFALIGLPG